MTPEFLFHGTSQECARQILEEGALRPSEPDDGRSLSPCVSFTDTLAIAKAFGDYIFQLKNSGTYALEEIHHCDDDGLVEWRIKEPVLVSHNHVVLLSVDSTKTIKPLNVFLRLRFPEEAKEILVPVRERKAFFAKHPELKPTQWLKDGKTLLSNT